MFLFVAWIQGCKEFARAKGRAVTIGLEYSTFLICLRLFPDGLTQKSCLSHYLRKNRGLLRHKAAYLLSQSGFSSVEPLRCFLRSKLHPALPELCPWTVTCDGPANGITLGVFVKISNPACLKKFKMNIFESTHNRSNHLFLVTLWNSTTLELKDIFNAHIRCVCEHHHLLCSTAWIILFLFCQRQRGELFKDSGRTEARHIKVRY